MTDGPVLPVPPVVRPLHAVVHEGVRVRAIGMDGALPLLAHHDLEALPAILADLEQVREAEAIEVHGRGLPLGPGAGDVALLREGARLGYQDLQDGVVLGASGRPQPLPQHLDLG
eukprot:CAMPEP_0175483846 /NCGR_PEP_ID=MMETSP0095-20121207/79690_1 /TAXON_ID=311494 /ORGANISM="Alexandrium monilatum, Strain CCMP3105" /LENGTH=114 /DNA_ID=CAMNT_0016785551 /DNA_START=210 /DNA_END=550 /DNA_ORIENTATION=+